MPTDLRSTTAAAAAVAIAAGAGCGGGTDDAEPLEGVGEVKVGSVAPLAQCSDWNAGDEQERLATIEDIRDQVNPQDASVDAPALSDQRAYELFESACRPAYSASFRLYKLYAQGASFEPLVGH